MSFEIKIEERIGIKFIQLINKNTNEFIEVIPSIGGAVNRIKFDIGGGVKDILRYDSDEELKEDLVANAWFRGRVLFPFNDMIPDGKYSFNGKDYQLYVNIKDENFAIHGFQYTKDTDDVVTQCDESSAKLILKYQTDGSDEGYPFFTELEIIYTLSNDGLRIDFKISNNSEDILPLALGWHPYYKLEGKSDEWVLKMDSKSIVEVDENLVPTGNTPSSSGTDFDFTEGKAINSREIDLALTVPENGIFELSDGKQVLKVEQDPKCFKYIQMYTPEDRESIAIEPVTAATNSFNFHNLGLISLVPKEQISTYVIVYSANKK